MLCSAATIPDGRARPQASPCRRRLPSTPLLALGLHQAVLVEPGQDRSPSNKATATGASARSRSCASGSRPASRPASSTDSAYGCCVAHPADACTAASTVLQSCCSSRQGVARAGRDRHHEVQGNLPGGRRRGTSHPGWCPCAGKARRSDHCHGHDPLIRQCRSRCHRHCAVPLVGDRPRATNQAGLRTRSAWHSRTFPGARRSPVTAAAWLCPQTNSFAPRACLVVPLPERLRTPDGRGVRAARRPARVLPCPADNDAAGAPRCWTPGRDVHSALRDITDGESRLRSEQSRRSRRPARDALRRSL